VAVTSDRIVNLMSGDIVEIADHHAWHGALVWVSHPTRFGCVAWLPGPGRLHSITLAWADMARVWRSPHHEALLASSGDGWKDQMAHAPFMLDEVAHLIQWQAADGAHPPPLICAHVEHGALAVETAGLTCPHCDFRQTWAPKIFAHSPPPPDPERDRVEAITNSLEAMFRWVKRASSVPPLGPVTEDAIEAFLKELSSTHGSDPTLLPAARSSDPEGIASRVAALTAAIELMEMHTDLVTPGGQERGSTAWATVKTHVGVLKDLLADLQARLLERPSS
jgi:hypothetical protein